MLSCAKTCATLLVGPLQAAVRANKMQPVASSNPKPLLPSTIVRDDEGALVQAAKSGDLTAFEELVNRYERRIFRLTMHITQNREDAEDATQDAFL